MKKSKLITLSILAATAIACDDQNDVASDVKHCVDNDGVVVDENQCDPASDAGLESTLDDSGAPVMILHGNSHIFYHYYYGGYTSPLTRGTRIIITNGGGWHPTVGHIYSTPSTFSRGGFGSTGHSFGGGEGAGG
jgi:hypothetical protein